MRIPSRKTAWKANLRLRTPNFWIFLLTLSVSIAAITIPPSAKAQKSSSQDAKQQPAAAAPAKAPDAGYVGAESCKLCHQDLYEGFEKSPHFVTTLDKRGGPSHQGCEGCHGPGAGHVANPVDMTKIFSFKTQSAKAINDRCLTCHASDKEHMNAINSLHAKNDVSCVSCHSPHHSKDTEFLLVKAQPELCYTCHLQKKPEFAMPSHHRVNEGLVQCTDCHNPHGTAGPKQVRVSAMQDQVCFTCHADKRGPFVFEHEVVKVEGCESCHNPHGSPNAHLLKVSNVNLLCLSCHTTSFASAPGAPSFHNQAAQYQACTLCHSQIHGSNFDSTFFK